jgi:lactate dehydrogenase-like 2-hydroxyacid dehydrogenase
MAKPELLVTAAMPDWDLDALAQDFTLRLIYAAPDRAAFLAEHGPNIRGMATKGEVGADAALIDALPKLEIISCYGVGIDAIDLPHATRRGIPVTNAPGVLTEDVADMAWALLLAAARRIPAGDEWVRSGDWAAKGGFPLTIRVWGKRLGIVGLGRIGQAIAKRAEAFGMTIGYSGRVPKTHLPYAFYASPEALAKESDVLIVAAQGGAETRGLVTKAAIDALHPRSILVNVARGTVVDEAALLAALRENRIGAAGLDVFLNEPRIDPAFLELDNVVLQPHNASGTVETRKAMGQLMGDNLRAHFAGRPLLTQVMP